MSTNKPTDFAVEDGSEQVLNLVYKTEHLINFHLLEDLLQLMGESYTIYKKLNWYCLHSLPLRKNMIKLGSVLTDSRIQPAYVIPSGHGKNNLKYVSDRIVSSCGYSSEIPTSHHPEQWVGKMVLRRKKKRDPETNKFRNYEEWEENRGYLSRDFVQIDEGLKLLTSKDEQVRETRKNICIAMDTAGRNKVEKKSVDTTFAEKISYFSECIIPLFFQPSRLLPEEIVTDGTARRSLWCYDVRIFQSKDDIYRKKLEGKGFSEDDLNKIADHILKIEDILKNYKWEFTDDAVSEIINLHLALLSIGRGHSKKGFYYTKITAFTLQEFLIKMSCILAGSRLTNVITADIVKLAFLDLTEFYISTLNFVKNKVQGSFDYGLEYQGANWFEQKALKFLVDEEAFSLEKSTVSVRQFKQKIAEVYNRSEKTAEYYYNNYKKAGWIASEQIGQYDSKVWLTFKPNVVQDTQVTQGTNIYNYVISNYNTHLGGLVSLVPLAPLTQPIEIRGEELVD